MSIPTSYERTGKSSWGSYWCSSGCVLCPQLLTWVMIPFIPDPHLMQSWLWDDHFILVKWFDSSKIGYHDDVQGGNYVVNLLDSYGTSMSVLFIVFIESVAVCWLYGMSCRSYYDPSPPARSFLSHFKSPLLPNSSSFPHLTSWSAGLEVRVDREKIPILTRGLREYSIQACHGPSLHLPSSFFKTILFSSGLFRKEITVSQMHVSQRILCMTLTGGSEEGREKKKWKSGSQRKSFRKKITEPSSPLLFLLTPSCWS